MFTNLVKTIMGDPKERILKRYRETVTQINALEPSLQSLSDDALRAKTDEFKRRLNDGETLDNLLPEAFAVVREASRRTTPFRHFDVQMIGGMVLHEGKIAEMKTGEGKTLVATLPLYLNALSGRGAHLVTPNDYLSKVGAQVMGPIYHFLGLSVGVIQNTAGDPNSGSYLFDPTFPSNDARFQNLRPCTRREAYAADITYGTNNEFGFDYLRDNMVWETARLVQRELNFAIVDEVDSILIDEARTPLIISGEADEPSPLYAKFAQIIRKLKRSSQESIDNEEPDGDYVIDEKDRVVFLTERGTDKVERDIGVQELYHHENAELIPYLDNSLRAHALYHLDKEYIVQDGQVIIVDEFTGRLMYGRRFSEGLHQAIEAKEGVKIRRENLTMATITFQNFFRMYKKLAGMTGTAATESEEFEKIYNLEVVQIPTHRPMVRQDYEDLIYTTEAAKFNAIVAEIKARQETGQPVLVGTVAIETSERLSKALKKAGIEHQVLNAKQHEREAEIITQAGRINAVTIATNMAGRGVDILLGGNPEGIARDQLRRAGVDLTQMQPEQWETAFAEAREQVARDREKVISFGGLFVLGTERHEARRIDNQLRGRSGRQGDPGETRFYLSLEDDLMRRFQGDRVKNVMNWAKLPEDEPIEHPWVSKAIEQAQIRVEGYNFDMRKRVLEYDDVVNKQREVIYRQRRELLTRDGMRDEYLEIFEEEVGSLVDQYCEDESDPESWDLEGLHKALFNVFPVPDSITPATMAGKSLDELELMLIEGVNAVYNQKTEAVTPQLMGQLERINMLQVIDLHWQRHLTDLDMLREGIGLMAIAQRDPLVEYKREAFGMWETMQTQIKGVAARRIFLMQVAFNPPRRVAPTPAAGTQAAGSGARTPEAVPAGAPVAAGAVLPQPRMGQMRAAPSPTMARAGAPVATTASAGEQAASKNAPARKTADIGRNDLCWCGSGKKYKNCHLKSDQANNGG